MQEHRIQESLQQNSLILFETLPYSPEKVQKNILACVVAPALNEESHIRAFLDSIHSQQTDYPVLVYLADNNSEDRTREIARKMGANVVIEPVRGIGPARQNGLDALKKISGVSHSNIILIQTDTDSALLHRNYIQKVCESYENQPELAATVGATHFPVNTRRKSPTMIRGGKQFKDTFNTLSFSELFSECGRDIHHYLLDPPFRMLIGANATYRLSDLEAHDIEYPKDTRWESVVVSVLLQMKMSSKRIGFIPEQEIVTSPRAYSNDRGIATKKKLAEIQSKRYIAPFKSENSVSPLETLRDLIEQIDRKTYGLSEHERVISYVSEYPDFILPNQRIECAYHAGTGLAIQGKYVLIEKEFAIYQQEAIEHAQRDLRIIQKIQDSLKEKNIYVMLDSGYAVESLTSQTIQRHHDDIDLILVAENPDVEALTQQILKSITDEQDSWRSEETKQNWIWLKNHTKDRTAPKQINIHVVNGSVEGTIITIKATNGATYTIKAKLSSLSAGNEHIEILSPNIEEMAASKIRLIEPYGNKPRMKDIFDIVRMISNSGFSRERCIEILVDYYMARNMVESEVAYAFALDQLHSFEQRIQYIQ